jgi:SAM-dependent methyltransferase
VATTPPPEPAISSASSRKADSEAAGAPDEAEWLDREDIGAAEAEAALVDLEKVYRLLLGRKGLVGPIFAAVSGKAAARCLDLGAGGGHVAGDLTMRARRRGQRLVVVGADRKLSHLLTGRRRGSPQVPVVADAAALPFRDGAFACAFSHLFFHHFDGATNRGIVGEMRRVAARVLVVDLRQSLVARLLARPCLRLLGLGPTAFHDGIVSVARSYDLASVAEAMSGLPVVELRRRFPYRWSMVVEGAAVEPAATPDAAGTPG